MQPVTDDPIDGTILVVEDDNEDILVLKRALAKAPLNLDVCVKSNGLEALSYLEEIDEANRLQDISLVLLDLNMPLLDGHSFLRKIRSDTRFAALPVVVLTTSREPEVIQRAYSDGANAVVSKADTLDGMMTIIDTIVQFWFKTASRHFMI
jgi:CheY-like chemotaxis protein